jgi:hypothetical protein
MAPRSVFCRSQCESYTSTLRATALRGSEGFTGMLAIVSFDENDCNRPELVAILNRHVDYTSGYVCGYA